mgnify:CR=1 FL=1
MFKVINVIEDRVIGNCANLDGANLLACYLSTRTSSAVAVYNLGQQMSRFQDGKQIAQVSYQMQTAITDALYTAGAQYDKNI